MGHYCTEHKTIFFKKGKMRGYAHPIGDTGEWCNEPEEGGDDMPENTPEPPTQYKADPDKTKSIQRQTALKVAGEIAVAKIMMGGEMTPAHILTTATLFESYLDNGATVEKKED